MTTAHPPSPVVPFGHVLELIEDRSSALRAAARVADPATPVPGCPDWTTRDLVTHLGSVHRFWAAAVAAGPCVRPPADSSLPGRDPSGELLSWSAECTALLLDALAAAGPEAECWTWWAASGHPATAGAVARHQMQEAAVHARDAQETAGAAEPLPAVVAMDAIDEFLQVGLGSMDGWPHSPARVALAADEGRVWTLILDSTGASAVLGRPGSAPDADAVLSGTAGDLLLALYRRVPWDAPSLRSAGDPDLVRQLVVWPPLG